MESRRLLVKILYFRLMLQALAMVLIALPLLLSSCRNDKETDEDTPEPTPYFIDVPRFFPTLLNIPADNPMTVEGIALGRYLFYDGRISGRDHPDSLMTCATCHLQSRSFECGIDHPKYTGGYPFGITGIPTPHVMLPLINLVWNHEGYLWNGVIHPSNPNTSKRRLEDLVWMGIVAPHEMNSDTNRAKALIQSIPGYPELFRKAFGSDVVTVERMAKAIAQFIRTFISSDSRFDQYLRGELQLTPQELNGFVLFSTESGADCFHCHGGSGNPLFTTNLFYNNGKDSLFTGPFEDPRDRYHVTGNPADLGAYKATTLRNIIYMGPYMHDGRFKTLDEVIDFYSDELVNSPYINPLMHHIATNGAKLTPTEKADLKAFILCLTDTVFLSNPAFSRPAVFPDGWTGK
ncbi:MAG TPA: cytochrome c peroxidase [Bacteroidales bacterium]|nr:cytochrome c peroxidase [Bacteroidales bacterium]